MAVSSSPQKKWVYRGYGTERIADRFRGFMPVVMDLETSGLDPERHAILEIAMVPLRIATEGMLHPEEALTYTVLPFAGAEMNPDSLKIIGITDPSSAQRKARSEAHVLADLFRNIRRMVSEQGCDRAVLVGHNATFDLRFLTMAAKRCRMKRNPFHSFSVLDTVSLAAMAFGQTRLSRACEAANIDFDEDQAHSSEYDAGKTAELFCCILNQWQHYVATDS